MNGRRVFFFLNKKGTPPDSRGIRTTDSRRYNVFHGTQNKKKKMVITYLKQKNTKSLLLKNDFERSSVYNQSRLDLKNTR